MNQHDAVTYADIAAAIVAGKPKPPASFGLMLKVSPGLLAQFLDANPEIATQDFYLFACRSRDTSPAIKPWTEVASKTRAAFEVFRATYQVLMRLVREEELAERERAQGKLTGARVVKLSERTFDDRVDGYHDRVKLR